MMADDILLLPLDILVYIFRKLNTSDLRNVMLTCKTLRDVIKNDSRIWRSFCRNSVIFRDLEGNRYTKMKCLQYSQYLRTQDIIVDKFQVV